MKIYYDGDCPFCSRYMHLMRLKKTVGDVTLINIRESKEAASLMIDKGYNLDKGMVVDYKDQYYWGADAINILALMSSNTTAFNALNKFIFSSKLISKALYPFMAITRRITLKILGRKTYQSFLDQE